MALQLTPDDTSRIARAVLTLRRNRSNSSNYGSREFEIAALRCAILRGEGRDYQMTLAKMLFLYPEKKDHYLVFMLSTSSLWAEICDVSNYYMANVAPTMAYTFANRRIQETLYMIGNARSVGFPFVIEPAALKELLKAFGSHRRRIEAGERSVTCTKCNCRKIVNATCEVCGFVPRTVTKRQAVAQKENMQSARSESERAS